MKIQPEVSKKIENYLKENQITQYELSELIHISPQSISKVMTTGKITENIADAIAKLSGRTFKMEATKRKPVRTITLTEIRYEYLMGIDSAKTEKELKWLPYIKAQHDVDSMTLGLISFCNVLGYDVTFSRPEGKSYEEARDLAFNDFMQITTGTDTKHLSAIEMNNLMNDICDFVEFKISKFKE